MVSGFRIQNIAVEGFKGFTTHTEIDLQGRHAFLLGKNGNGKSSILEAIRWGLFGSTGRPNEIVANRGYAGRCRVELALMREGKQWKFRRQLIRGASGGSDAELTDEHGQEQPIREVMPQLDSLDAGEGTHIIFAPQAAPLRRQSEDLSPFERTVFNHLGLTHPRSLLSQLDGFLVSQELAEHSLGEKLTEARSEIDKQIAELERQRGRILSSPPWEDSRSPTLSESENKVRALFEEIAGRPPDQSLSGLSLDALIDNAEDAVQAKRDQGQGVAKGELADLEQGMANLGALCDIQANIETQQSEMERVQSELNATLDGMSIGELQDGVHEEQVAADAVVLRRQVVENSILLLRCDVAESILCPICETEHRRHDLEVKLQHVTSQLPADTDSTLGQLEARLKQAEALEREVQNLGDKLAQLEQSAIESRETIRVYEGKALPGQLSLGQLSGMLTTLHERKSSVNAMIENQAGWFDSTQARLSRLKEEGRFHQCQKQLGRLQQSKNRIGEVKRSYDGLVSFGESVRTIRLAVNTCLTKRLEEESPGVSANLSQVFAALTRHPWFDRLIIAEDKLPKLELQVTSSQDPSSLGHPTGVLNGQAEGALDIVPYFAFSQADDAPTEVYLVLLDDPTRAFDEEHIGILVERLAELGRNVQLIVASQETAKFRELLPQHFDSASYVVVEPNNWSYQNGPQLDIEYA